MENLEIKTNQQLLSNKVTKLFVNLGFKEENIISQITEGVFQGNDISTADSLKNEIQKIINSNNSNEKVIVFKLGANGREFKENQEENNHYVALYFDNNNNIHYIDPTGSPISVSVKNSSPILRLVIINNSETKLQYTNEQNIGKDNYIMGGNDYDCGVLLPLAVNLIKQDHKKRDQINLNEEDSRKVGELLREVLNGKTFDEVEKDIYQILESSITKKKEEAKTLEKGLSDLDVTDTDTKKKLFENVKLWHLDLKSFVKFCNHTNKVEIEKNIKDVLKNLEITDVSAKNWPQILKAQQIKTMEDLKSYYNKFNSDNPNPMGSVLDEYKKFIGESERYSMQEILFREIAEIQKGKTIQQGIIEGLKKYKFIADNDEIELKPAGSGKSGCQIAFIENKKYYIKPFSYASQKNPSNSKFSLCNPKEALLYKILEKINFGPKTNFLLNSGSSISGSIQKENYIMTEEVPNLFLDNQKGKDIFDIMKNSNNKKDVVELSCASVLKGLLSLGDVFPDNNENYGITQDKKFMFIDHHPSTNGDFVDKGEELNKKREQEYSPRLQMSEMCNKDIYKNTLLGNLFDVESKSYDNFVNKALAKDVNRRLFEENNIEKALLSASEEIKALIKDNQSSFTEDAEKEAEELVNKIQKNIENYKKTEYAKSGGIGKQY